MDHTWFYPEFLKLSCLGGEMPEFISDHLEVEAVQLTSRLRSTGTYRLLVYGGTLHPHQLVHASSKQGIRWRVARRSEAAFAVLLPLSPKSSVPTANILPWHGRNEIHPRRQCNFCATTHVAGADTSSSTWFSCTLENLYKRVQLHGRKPSTDSQLTAHSQHTITFCPSVLKTTTLVLILIF